MSPRRSQPPAAELDPEEPEKDPDRSSGPPPAPPWTRTLTLLVALGWGTAELAFWGGRPQAFGFIGMVLMLAYGVGAAAKVRELMP